ncbi:hypothetical protein PV328_010325 [Microctonus aethiopoides]|uniref:Uncharacterized protein n=1 Tax=Microctonus aethiopoides TaxID=144406 RepID=A0AA39EYS3_9HYME|nr:hypothetical protein PV328_010325 [Microctonus aethiopoides]
MGCNTCYEYENINGQLLKLIHGTWHIDTQIANSQCEFIKMNRLIGLLSEENIRNFCLRRKRQVKITEQLQERCYRVGICKRFNEVPNAIIDAIENCGLRIRNNNTMRIYFRLLKNDKLHISDMYSRSMQTKSSIVAFMSDDQYKFGANQCFIRHLICNCIQDVCQCNSQNYAFICEMDCNSVFGIEGDHVRYRTEKFLPRCQFINIYSLVPIGHLITPCIFIEIIDNKQKYIAIPINAKELE